MIVLIVGDSGVGKSTIALKILENLENVNLVKSYTTREKEMTLMMTISSLKMKMK